MKKIKNSNFLFNPLLSDEDRSEELEWQNHEYFLDQTFYETWNEYMTVRDEKKIPAWSPTQLKAQWNKLKKYSDTLFFKSEFIEVLHCFHFRIIPANMKN